MNILEKAHEFTTLDRNSQYGEPEDNFQRIADYWNNYMNHKRNTRLVVYFTCKDVAMLMTLMKVAREDFRHNIDNLIDACGYLRCASKIEGDEIEDNRKDNKL